jgi:GAF domain-containing protein
MASRPFVPPSRAVQSSSDRRSEHLARASLWMLLIWSVSSGAVGAATTRCSRATVSGSVLVFGLLAVGALGGQWLARSGRVQAAAWFVIVLFYVGLTVVAALWGPSVLALYGVLVLAAGLLLGKKVASLAAALSVVAALSVAGFQAVGKVPAVQAWGPALYWVEGVLALGWVTWLVNLEMGSREALSLRPGQQSMRSGPEPVNSGHPSQLEQLKQRNRYLQVVASISQDTAGLVDENELLPDCAESIRSWLAFSRVCIYLVEADGGHLAQGVCAETGDKAGASPERDLGADPSNLARLALRSKSPLLGLETVLGDRAAPDRARAEAALPLRIDGEVVGVLELHDQEGEGFCREDIALLQLVADQVAASIRWVRAISQLQRKDVQIGDDGYESVSDEWRRTLRTHRQLAVIRNEHGLIQDQDAWRPEMSLVVASGEIAFGDPGQTVMAVPVLVRDQAIAVVSARKPENGAPWTQREVALVQAICAQVGQAIENARLYEAVQRREERERLLGQATARMRESLDVETVLHVAVDEIRHALGLAALEVRLEMDNETNG